MGNDPNDAGTCCDVCGCESAAVGSPDTTSMNLCPDCAWQEIHVVKRPRETVFLARRR